MRLYLLALPLAAITLLAPRAYASNVLQDACGADNVKFNVTTTTDQPALAVPEGKSLLVFISTVGFLFPPPVRYGVDGVWAGAAKNKSYFAYAVEPGKHHLCYSMKGRRFVGATSVTTEAGKIYFYEFRAELQAAPVIGGAGGGGMAIASSNGAFTQLDEDQGRFLAKRYAPATSTPNK